MHLCNCNKCINTAKRTAIVRIIPGVTAVNNVAFRVSKELKRKKHVCSLQTDNCADFKRLLFIILHLIVQMRKEVEESVTFIL